MSSSLYPAAEVNSTYGPRGKSKILVSSGGDVVITRDGGQLLQYACSTAPAHLPVVKMLLDFQDRFGDGALTLGVVLSSLCEQARGGAGAGGGEAGRRVRLDRALMHVQRASAGAALQEGLLSCGLWRSVPIRSAECSAIEQLWMSMLVPASNAKLAEQLVPVMRAWSLPEGASRESLAAGARSALRHFDAAVLTVPGAELSRSRAVGGDDLLIQGACRESLAPLAGRGDQQHFVCFHWIGAPPGEGEGRWLGVDSACRLAVRRMQAGGVRLLLSGAPVGDAVRFLLAAAEIAVVDCVPLAHLQAAAARGCRVHHGQYDFTEHCCGSATSVDGEASRKCFPSFSCMSTLHVARSDQPTSAPGTYFEINGVRGDAPLPSSAESAGMRQLILRAPSSAVAGIYRKLILRCLRIMVSALEPAGPCGDSSVAAVPGGGAAELMWSALWECAAHAISCMVLRGSDAAPARSGGEVPSLGRWIAFRIVAGVVADYRANHPMQQGTDLERHDCGHCLYRERCGSVCNSCADIVSTYLARYSSVRSSVVCCEEACRMIGIAYRLPPLLLFTNAFKASSERIALSNPEKGLNSLFETWKLNYTDVSTTHKTRALGLFCSDDMLSRAESLRDPFEMGIISHCNAFLQGFQVAIYCARQQARIHSVHSVLRCGTIYHVAKRDQPAECIDFDTNDDINDEETPRRHATVLVRADILGQTRRVRRNPEQLSED